ncbi:WecB/TagA/CpsF family glycosyltransferase [Candidatus Daviesbacteria bacterium]|nr:WecB/TagA/CpsF family glycosyltransferase [Candidatus Daviesbacteria bacterium]
MEQVNILGVKVSKVNYQDVLKHIQVWISGQGKHYIVTTNVEIIIQAQKDLEFKKIINDADLSIPDSSRLGWALKVLETNNFIVKLIYWPFFIFPKLIESKFPTVTGTDLILKFMSICEEKGFRIGLLGGQKNVAAKAKERLLTKFPNLKIVYTDHGGKISSDGEMLNNEKIKIEKVDILLVAFGHGKQEKWIKENIKHIDSKVFIGVGGTLDYISGKIPRAPLFIRLIGFEWLFRLIVQPWRIKRFDALVKFIFLILKK